MKKKAAFLKIFASAVIIILGLVIFFMGISDGFMDFYGRYTSYESYGGDAYTGIQNAAADTAVNVENFGYALEEAVNMGAIFGGLLVAFLGIYLLAAALPGLKEEKCEAEASAPTTTL